MRFAEWSSGAGCRAINVTSIISTSSMSSASSKGSAITRRAPTTQRASCGPCLQEDRSRNLSAYSRPRSRCAAIGRGGPLPALPDPDRSRMRRLIVTVRRRLGHPQHDRPPHIIGAQLAAWSAYQLAGELGDGVADLRRGQRGDEIIENRLKMVNRISVAEPAGQGECSLDVVPIDCQVAPVGAEVQHLADHAGEYKPDRCLDRFT